MKRAAFLVAALALLGPGPAVALEGLQPGMRAPRATLETLDGKPLELAPGPGTRALLVVFWASWSGKSPEVLERAQKLHAGLGGQGLRVIGVNVESQSLTAAERTAATTLAQRLAVAFPLALDRGLEAFHAYGVVAVPSSVLIGSDGTVLASLAGYPIAGREDFFDLVEATARGRPTAGRAAPTGPEPHPRAVRYYHLGRAMAARGLWEQAVSNLERAVDLDASFVLPRVLLGRLLRERALNHEMVETAGVRRETVHVSDGERARRLAEAERLLADAVRLAPTSAVALTELARLRLDRGDAAEARRLLERARKADPAHPGAQALLGALLLDGGQVEQGRAELAQAIASNPLDWRLHVAAAEAFDRRGMQAEALGAYRRAVELLWTRGREMTPDAR